MCKPFSGLSENIWKSHHQDQIIIWQHKDKVVEEFKAGSGVVLQSIDHLRAETA